MTAAEFGDDRLPGHFWSKVRQDPSGCWIWTGFVNNGYGQFGVDARPRYAHRVAYSALVGDLPDYRPGGLQCDHLCRTRACVNPAHIELVDPRTNTLRGNTLAAREVERTHCPEGHPLEGDNLIPSLARRGMRSCLECDRALGRVRSRTNYEVVSMAVAETGLTWAEYRARFGQSTKVAREILDAYDRALETEEPEVSPEFLALVERMGAIS